MKKKIVSIFLVFFWMMLIFTFSHFDGQSSTKSSMNSIKNSINVVVNTTNKVGVTKKSVKQTEKINKISKKLNYPVRKFMHLTEYFILTFLVYNMFFQFNVERKKNYLYSIFICYLYACCDEIHQLFTMRTSSYIDVLIDTLGGLLAIYIIYIYTKGKRVKLLE